MQTSFRVWFPPLTKVAQTSKRRNEFVFPWLFFGREFNCSLCANFTSEYKLNIADRIFPFLPLLVSELLTFHVNCLLNDDSYEAGEILGVLLKEMLYLKFKIMMKPYFYLYLKFLSRQLDTDDANDNENDIDIFSRTDKHRTYEIPQRKQFVHNKSIWIAHYSFSSTLGCNTFTFYFSCSRILCSRTLLGTVTTIF